MLYDGLGAATTANSVRDALSQLPIRGVDLGHAGVREPRIRRLSARGEVVEVGEIGGHPG